MPSPPFYYYKGMPSLPSNISAHARQDDGIDQKDGLQEQSLSFFATLAYTGTHQDRPLLAVRAPRTPLCADLGQAPWQFLPVPQKAMAQLAPLWLASHG